MNTSILTAQYTSAGRHDHPSSGGSSSKFAPTAPRPWVAPQSEQVSQLMIDVRELLSTAAAASTQAEPFPYTYRTRHEHGPGGDYLPLQSWSDLERLVALIAASPNEDYLVVVRTDGSSRVAQVWPNTHDDMHVEVDDNNGWFMQVASSRDADGTWSREQAVQIVRHWLEHQFLRGDAQRSPIPRRHSSEPDEDWMA